MKIELKPFKDVKYEVWSESQGFIGLATDLQIHDIRIQCMQNNIFDVYIKYEDRNIYITEAGDYSSFPRGFLDHTNIFFATIIKLKLNKLDKTQEYKITEALEKYNNYCQKYLL